jgi:hypothetical protein
MNATNQSIPAAVGQTKPDNLGKVTDVPVPTTYTVTYVFKVTSTENLKLPFAVAINDVVSTVYKTKPGVVIADGLKKLEVKAFTGDKVALYLNSDAHPSYRKTPVYEVTVGQKNVLVKVNEKAGKHTDTDTPVLQADAADKAKIDTYDGVLTGDIWMKISHAYATTEVAALLPTATSAEVAAAVSSIYGPLTTSQLRIGVPASATRAAFTLSIKFEDSDNPNNNISQYLLLRDGLPRVHPAGYAALFNAAIENGISSMTVTSCWRPMLGSIAHRAGLGLDVNYVGDVRMNRQELRTQAARGVGNRNDNDNVTDAEVSAFKEYEQSIVDKKRAENELTAAYAALKKAQNSGQGLSEAQQRVEAANIAARDAPEKEEATRKSWDAERKNGEPSSIRQFRLSLLKCSCVGQLFDPWYIYKNARGEGEANMQTGPSTSLERLHAHHLHVTVHEPKIL